MQILKSVNKIESNKDEWVKDDDGLAAVFIHTQASELIHFTQSKKNRYFRCTLNIVLIIYSARSRFFLSSAPPFHMNCINIW